MIHPSRIVIRNEDKFAATFPDLVNAIPIMLAHQGAQPYTNGEPACAIPIAVTLVDEKYRRKTLPFEWNPSRCEERYLLEPKDSVEKAFTRILKAKISPNLTVEAASNLAKTGHRKTKPVSAEVEQVQLNMLKAAGLKIETSGKLPPGIVIENPVAFSRKFPEMVKLIRVMYAYDGVQPYTKGLPRRTTPKGLLRAKRAAA